MDLPDDPLKLMAQIGALCSDLGNHDRALAVFTRLAAVRRDEAPALVALALAQSRAGQGARAAQTLRDVLHADPTDEMARVLLALELHREGLAEGSTLLQSVLDDARSGQSRDADALALARAVRDDVLGPPAPAPTPSSGTARFGPIRYSSA